MQFYSPDSQTIAGPVRMLPQKGSVSGGSKRPLNSYAILGERSSILFDAPYTWTVPGIDALVADGTPPRALVLSHRNTAGSGDAFDRMVQTYDLPILLHPDDQKHPEADGAGVPFEDTDHPLLREAGIEVIHVPGHTDGSVMLYLPDEGGILLAGDSAVGPGPEQSDRTPRLERPKMDDDAQVGFVEVWKRVVVDRPIAAVLPLHGAAYLRADHPDDFDAIVANIWTGPPMDPSRT